MADTNKRIVMVIGGKGGTGKTLFARLLYYALVESKVKVVGIDSDIENPEFATYHQSGKFNVFCLDFLSIQGGVKLLETVSKKKPNVVVIDMPAASGEQSREQMKKFDLLSLDKEMGYRLSLATVLNNGFPPIHSLAAMMECCGNRADYVAVRNEFWKQGGVDFGRWESSDAYQYFRSLNGVEIMMPTLEVSTFDALHPSTPFFNVETLPLGHKLLALSFLRRGLTNLEAAALYLGMPGVTTTEEAA